MVPCGYTWINHRGKLYNNNNSHFYGFICAIATLFFGNNRGRSLQGFMFCWKFTHNLSHRAEWVDIISYSWPPKRQIRMHERFELNKRRMDLFWSTRVDKTPWRDFVSSKIRNLTTSCLISIDSSYWKGTFFTLSNTRLILSLASSTRTGSGSGFSKALTKSSCRWSFGSQVFSHSHRSETILPCTEASL